MVISLYIPLGKYTRQDYRQDNYTCTMVSILGIAYGKITRQDSR